MASSNPFASPGSELGDAQRHFVPLSVQPVACFGPDSLPETARIAEDEYFSGTESYSKLLFLLYYISPLVESTPPLPADGKKLARFLYSNKQPKFPGDCPIERLNTEARYRAIHTDVTTC